MRVEACVTRSPDGKTDTYTYTVTNESFLVLECGMCWFSIPNPGNLATVSQTGPEGWTTTPTWRSERVRSFDDALGCPPNDGHGSACMGVTAKIRCPVAGPPHASA